MGTIGPAAAALSADEIQRYSRHLVLPQVGLDGQRALKAAKVLCVGAGGLGSPISMYLAAAGVGTVGVVDYDVVDYSNLQRQIVHMTRDVGRPKVESARERLKGINPEIRVQAHGIALSSVNALSVIAQYDIVVDGTDNFPTRYLLNDACVLLRRPYIYGSIFRFEGQTSVFAVPGGPCYRCLYPEPPPPGLVPSCAEGGVLGVVPGIIGTIQANEALKLILKAGDSLVGRMLILDALAMTFRELRVKRDAECPVCGDRPTIRELQDYEQFCGMRLPGEQTDPADFEISPEELRDALDRVPAPILLDIREPMEFQLTRLPGAVLMPLAYLTARLGELDATRDIVVYCHHGGRSLHAARLLRGAGFRARHLTGGLLAWADRINPDTLRY